MKSTDVLVVGAGPAGLATAACLGELSIPYAVLERDDCSAPLWRKRAYDRLKLHLAKEFCALPHMPFPADAPTYIPKDEFVRYLDGYIERFGIQPRYGTAVEACAYDAARGRWAVEARDVATGEVVAYEARFLVVATGENSAGHIPEITGLEGFPGETIHSSSYRSGAAYGGQRVLVVGCGNSGMEIAYDLASHGAETSIVIRSPVHVMTKELIRLGMTLAQGLPLHIVDRLLLTMANLWFGDLSSHGIVRPAMGPLVLKAATGRSAVIDVGTVGMIKMGVIKVFGAVSRIIGNVIEFEDGMASSFDAIVFATGFKSTANMLLKNSRSMLDDDGLPKKAFPNHWKGANGLYCAGLARRGLAGMAFDAKNIASDIKAKIGSVQ